jgi:hypothetical protein
LILGFCHHAEKTARVEYPHEQSPFERSVNHEARNAGHDSYAF